MLRLFSGHDTGLYSHMLLLNISSLECHLEWIESKSKKPKCETIPDFASSFIYELSRRDGKSYIRLLYNGVSQKVCRNNWDDNYCIFDEFVQTASKRLLYHEEDFSDFCGNIYFKSYKSSAETTSRKLTWLVFVFIALFLCLVLCFVMMVVHEERLLAMMRGRSAKVQDNYVDAGHEESKKRRNRKSSHRSREDSIGEEFKADELQV